MSILIKGMEMPKNCGDCPLFESKYHYHGCHAVPKSFNDMGMWDFVGDRPSWCPLIELPPHGRLIDADALHIDLMDRGIADIQTNDWYEIRQAVDDAPTIIESEGEDG